MTARIRSGISCQSRPDQQLSHPAVGRQAGSITFELDNSDGLYDLENTSSSLHGPDQTPVSWQCSSATAASRSGRVCSTASPPPTRTSGRTPRPGSRRGASGPPSAMQRSPKGSLEPASTIQAVCEILETIDVCGVPDPGGRHSSQMDRWWEIGQMQDADPSHGGHGGRIRLRATS